MYSQDYFVEKRNGTYADTLVAYGLASVLDEIMRRSRGTERGRSLWLDDRGPYYTLTLDTKLHEEDVDNCELFTVVPFVQRSDIQPPEGFPSNWVRDASEERKTNNQYWEERNRLGGNVTDADAYQAVADLKPAPDYRTLECLADMKMLVASVKNKKTGTINHYPYNALAVKWWRYQRAFHVHLRYFLKMGMAPAVDLDLLAKQWAKEVKVPMKEADHTCAALFNPSQGQGQNYPRASYLNTRTNIDEFWLYEYLKAAGFWMCGLPRKVRPPKREPSFRDWDTADRKVYIWSPKHLSFQQHRKVYETFSERLSSETSITQDIVSLLLFARSWLNYVDPAQTDEFDFDRDPNAPPPEEVISGFHVVQYKPLSERSYTMLHAGFLEIPRWTGVLRDRKDVDRMQQVFDDHLRVIRSIDETRSDGYDLLRLYRSFIAGGQWESFFQFAVSYSAYLMRERHRAYSQGRKPDIRQFSQEKLEVLMEKSKTDFMPILDNEGFRRIAKAIRQSTVQAQYSRYEKDDRRYDVRYGLGQELAQKAHDAAEFAAALSEFLGRYNAESAQVREGVARQYSGEIPPEVEKTLRGRVSDDDIADLLTLIPRFGSEVVCHLLVAVGYSWEGRAPRSDGS